jgi:hypothetical protein
MDLTMEQGVNVKFCVKLQKSPTGQTPVDGLEIEEFSQAKEATDVVLLLRHQEFHPI